jgi:hypothetical protein
MLIMGTQVSNELTASCSSSGMFLILYPFATDDSTVEGYYLWLS